MIQIDEIGVIYAPAIDEETPPEALPGWHVIATHKVPGWEAQQVYPANPTRVFGGITTYFYVFDNEAAYNAALEVADLTLPPPVQARQITKLAFRNRFTTAEKVTLEIAQLDNPAAPIEQRSQAAALRSSQADLAAATFVDLDRADTRAGVQILEAAGLLAAGRALEILDAPVQAGERPL